MAELSPEELAKEEEITSGLLPFTIDGTAHVVLELKWQANRAWKVRMQTAFASLVNVPSDTPDGLNAMADVERELVLAYDQTHALGDLDDATEREIDAIYNRLVTVAFPLATSPTAAMLAIVRAAVALAQENSTNGPSLIGTTGTPTILKDHLPSGRSSSSTRRRKSA